MVESLPFKANKAQLFIPIVALIIGGQVGLIEWVKLVALHVKKGW
ncbi:hypothetical protein [Enterococcus sp. AZ196]